MMCFTLTFDEWTKEIWEYVKIKINNNENSKNFVSHSRYTNQSLTNF